jgi:hypothetical protein
MGETRTFEKLTARIGMTHISLEEYLLKVGEEKELVALKRPGKVPLWVSGWGIIGAAAVDAALSIIFSACADWLRARIRMIHMSVKDHQRTVQFNIKGSSLHRRKKQITRRIRNYNLR